MEEETSTLYESNKNRTSTRLKLVAFSLHTHLLASKILNLGVFNKTQFTDLSAAMGNKNKEGLLLYAKRNGSKQEKACVLELYKNILYLHT